MIIDQYLTARGIDQVTAISEFTATSDLPCTRNSYCMDLSVVLIRHRIKKISSLCFFLGLKRL